VLGNQDTLLVDSPDAPVIARSYFVNSYIQGDVDFIFGRGTAVFDRSTINALSRGSSSNNGYVIAASTSDKNPNGILVTDSTITSNAPAGTFSLGRPWRGWTDGYTKNGVAYNSRGQVTIRNTALPAAIRTTQPWADMSPNLWTDGRLFEYGNTGAGATVNANRPQLTEAQAAGSTTWTYLAGSDGWNPTGQAAPVVADTTAPAAPPALAATAGDGKAVLNWTAPSDTDVAGYNVYRSGTGTASTSSTKVNGSAPVTGSGFADTGLTNGTDYSYVVTAVDAAGNESVASAAARATPVVGDSTPPAVPAGLSARLGKSTVTVSWTAVSDADLVGYVVHRSTGSGAAVTVSGDVPVAGPSFTDSTGTIGTAYRYTVVAVDTAGNESAASGSVSATPVKADVIVATDGSGDATTVQGGIDLLANDADFTAQGGRVVLVQPGTYPGTVTSRNRYGVTLVGATADAKDTVLTAPGGTIATFTVSGKAWTFRNLTIASVAAAKTPGTAVKISSGDQQVFDNVRLLGENQTLIASTANNSTYSRVYVGNSFIEGGTDIIIGRAVTVIENSTIHVLARANATITDSSVSSAHPYGILITDSKVVTDGGANTVYLGRPYPESATAQAQVVVRDTELGAGINTAQPWRDYISTSANVAWTTGRFSEYRNTGTGATVNAYRPQLSDADAANYTAKAYLAGSDNWNPTGQ
jgi:pectin methylesterase-like acyl-CoA thioesterase